MGTLATQSLIGQTVGNHRVVARLGEGGMGIVYLAEHPQLGRKAAIKVLHHEFSRRPDVVDRFFNEARAAARLRHPGIIEIYDFGTLADESAYIVMEFLEGEALATRLARLGRLSVQDALAITHQLCRALATAHRQGIVHRDLKPDNVYLVGDQEVLGRERAKLLDFGIAKLLDDSGLQGSKTHTGAILGTPVYMSPEQCEGAGHVDHRSDIYSLGVILYEMLTSKPPFTADGIGKLLAMHMSQPPVPPRERDGRIPAEVSDLVLHMLAKEKAERFQTCDEVATAIEGLVGTVVLYADSSPSGGDASTFRAPSPTGTGRSASSPGAAPRTPAPPLRTPAPRAPAAQAPRTPIERPPHALAGPTVDNSAQHTVALPDADAGAAPAAGPRRTTLSGGAATLEPVAPRAAAGGRRWIAVAVGVIVLAGAGGAVAVFAGRSGEADADGDDGAGDDPAARLRMHGGDGDDGDGDRKTMHDPHAEKMDTAAPRSAMAATDAPATAATTASAAPATAATGSARIVRIDVATTPGKAKVYRLPGGELLGETPCKVLLETSDAEVEMALRRAGYKEERVKVGGDGGKVNVKLTKAPVVKGGTDDDLAIPRDDALSIPR